MKSKNLRSKLVIIFMFFLFFIHYSRTVSLLKSNYRNKEISSTNNSTNQTNITNITNIATNYTDLIEGDEINLEEKKRKIWNELFETAYSESCVGYNTKPKPTFRLMTNLSDLLPRKRDKSIYEKGYGTGPVAYLFDYLDKVISDQMAKEFQKVWDSATKLKNDIVFIANNTSIKLTDPYDLTKVMSLHNYILTGSNITLNASLMTGSEITERMRRLSDEFDLDTFQNSINVPTLRLILMRWGWYKKYDKPDVSKYLIDNYDMDGDGRLNLREFILLSIHNNEFILGSHECHHCYRGIIETRIDPFYDFMDCQGKDLISTIEICNGLKNMKRNSDKTYNMFTCTFDNLLYHSASCNDLILKNHKTKNGVLTKTEFRKGILLGYWDRMTNKTQVLSKDEITQKETRWSDSGNSDISCNKLNQFK
jgi:hypothetical protein